jgi:polygalacturonase
MKIGFSWLAAASAALVVFAVPAAAATGAQVTGTPDVTAAAPTHQLAVATGDPRHPGQPRLPRTCVTLWAGLSTSTGEFSSADETTPPDTSRIQWALDRCADTGRAVVLAAGGPDNSFLSGPITIQRHEALVIDDGVTL